jgi:hypothetical protein
MVITIGESGDSGSFNGSQHEVEILKWKVDCKKIFFQVEKDGVNYYGVANNIGPYNWKAERLVSNTELEEAKVKLNFKF